jgi:hypothetical protein
MPAILQGAAERRHNGIVQPRPAGATLIKLADLDGDAAAPLRPVSSLVLRTSPGNYQAWVGELAGALGVGNGLHWVRDVAFGEGRSRNGTGHAGANLGMLRRVAASLEARAGEGGRSDQAAQGGLGR